MQRVRLVPQAVREGSVRPARWVPQVPPALPVVRPALRVRKALQARRVRGDTQALRVRLVPGVRQARGVKRGRKAQ